MSKLYDRDSTQEEAYQRSTIRREAAMNMIAPLEDTFPQIFVAAKTAMDANEPDIAEVGKLIVQSFGDILNDIREQPIMDEAASSVDQLMRDLREETNNVILLGWLLRERRRIEILQNYISSQNKLFDDMWDEDLLLPTLSDIPDETEESRRGS